MRSTKIMIGFNFAMVMLFCVIGNVEAACGFFCAMLGAITVLDDDKRIARLIGYLDEITGIAIAIARKAKELRESVEERGKRGAE